MYASSECRQTFKRPRRWPSVLALEFGLETRNPHGRLVLLRNTQYRDHLRLNVAGGNDRPWVDGTDLPERRPQDSRSRFYCLTKGRRGGGTYAFGVVGSRAPRNGTLFISPESAPSAAVCGAFRIFFAERCYTRLGEL